MPARTRATARRETGAFTARTDANTFWSRAEAGEAIGALLAIYEARHGMTSADFWAVTRETRLSRSRPLTRHEMSWLSWYDVHVWLTQDVPVLVEDLSKTGFLAPQKPARTSG